MLDFSDNKTNSPCLTPNGMARLHSGHCHLKSCLTATSTSTHLRFPPKEPNCRSNFTSTKQHCLFLLQGCTGMHQLYQIQAHILTFGLGSDEFLLSELVKFCALSPSGSLNYARSLLDQTVNPLRRSWNSIIRGYSQSDSPKEAILIYSRMRARGIGPNKLTFPSLLKACSRISVLREGKEIHGEIVKIGLDSDICVQNTLIHLYASCEEIVDARQLFDEMPVKTIVSWNAMISGFVQNSCLEEAIMIFVQMRASEYELDEATMVILLSACTKLGNLSLGKWLHCHVIKKAVVMTLQLGTALVDMYAKCGSIDSARQLFDGMPERNVWTWSAMILGLAQHGLAKEALELFAQMKSTSIRPNYVTFLGVLCACSHAGWVDDGCQFFDDMTRLHGIKPMMMHYGVMVDMLGRGVCLEEAYRFIKSMPMEPDAVVWRTLLGACSIHHDAPNGSEIGEKVMKALLELEPNRCGNYVMVSNMYAEIGMWEEVAHVRRVMREGGMKKVVGESFVEVGGSIFNFVCGDGACINSHGVFRLLDALNAHMKASNDRDYISGILNCY